MQSAMHMSEQAFWTAVSYWDRYFSDPCVVPIATHLARRAQYEHKGIEEHAGMIFPEGAKYLRRKLNKDTTQDEVDKDFLDVTDCFGGVPRGRKACAEHIEPLAQALAAEFTTYTVDEFTASLTRLFAATFHYKTAPKTATSSAASTSDTLVCAVLDGVSVSDGRGTGYNHTDKSSDVPAAV